MRSKSQTSRRRTFTIAVVAVGALLIEVAHLVWPQITLDATALFLIAVVALVWLYPWLKSVTLPGGLGFELKEDKDLENQAKAKADEAIKEAMPAPQAAVKWEMVATLFWFGNDLMWIQDQLYRGSAPERVLQGINHALRYAEELGFDSGSLPCQDLTLAKMLVETLVGFIPSTDDKKRFLEVHYKTIEQYVQTVKWYIHALASIKQPGFEKLRAL